MSDRQVPSARRWRTVVRVVIAVAVLAVTLPGCSRLGIRRHVSVEQARDVLTRAVGLAASGQADQLCTLSSAEASTCPDSLADLGGLVPETGPRVTCVVPAPDFGPLRNGQVLVVEGTDGAGDDYTTEFVVYDDGDDITVLDAVFWSGLTVVDYTEDTVAWRFDSATRACERGGLAVTPQGG